MAIRNIREMGDPVLNKTCKPVTEVTERIAELIEDMFETMYDAKVRAYDEEMKPFEIEGTELLARAFCHEIDHLDGHLYVEKVEGELMSTESPEQ